VPRGTTVGIDLGTSNTCVALCVGAKPEVIQNQQGERTTPSVVAFVEDEKILVGSPAWRQAVMNPRRTITAVKRLVGQRYESAATRDLERTLPYALCASALGDAWVKIDDQQISPQEVQARILERVREDAVRYCNGPVTGAVITVPAFFDEIQRQAVRDSAEIAGFENARVLSEPTAAALAYGYAQLDNRKVVVADFGGGTLDITIMSVNQGRFEVLATDGDLLLGGTDFDRSLAKAFAAEIQAQHGIDVLADPIAVQRLLSEAEAAKRTLSQEQSATITLPHLVDGKDGPVHFNRTITRQEFESICQPLVARIVGPCQKAMAEAKLTPKNIDEVILVGGMTRMPLIQKRIGELFQRTPKLRVNPDEVVAMGASLLAAADRRDDITFVDVVPRALGLRVAGNQMSTLIAKSTPLPAKVTKAFATTHDHQDFFELEVLQGEDAAATKNRHLATVRLEPIPKKKAGEVKLKVTFEIDQEGRLGVSALEMSTQTETQARIQPMSGLTRAEVEALRKKFSGGVTESVAASSPAVPVQSGFSISFGNAVAEGTPKPELTKPAPAARAAAAPRKPPAKARPAVPAAVLSAKAPTSGPIPAQAGAAARPGPRPSSPSPAPETSSTAAAQSAPAMAAAVPVPSRSTTSLPVRRKRGWRWALLSLFVILAGGAAAGYYFLYYLP
jgi:molecular chaperone DnaK